MSKEIASREPGLERVRADIVGVMKEMDLPAPERMLGRIERMLDEKDRDRVLRQLLEDFRKQSPEEVKKVLRVLAPDAEWAKEVDRLLANYRPMA